MKVHRQIENMAVHAATGHHDAMEQIEVHDQTRQRLEEHFKHAEGPIGADRNKRQHPEIASRRLKRCQSIDRLTQGKGNIERHQRTRRSEAEK